MSTLTAQAKQPKKPGLCDNSQEGVATGGIAYIIDDKSLVKQQGRASAGWPTLVSLPCRVIYCCFHVLSIHASPFLQRTAAADGQLAQQE